MKLREYVTTPIAVSFLLYAGMIAACATSSMSPTAEAGKVLQGKKYKLTNKAKAGEKRVYIDLEGGFEAVNPTPEEEEAHTENANKAMDAGAEFYIVAAVPESRIQSAHDKVMESPLTPGSDGETTLTCKSVKNGVMVWSVPTVMGEGDSVRKTVSTLKMDARGVVATSKQLETLKDPLWNFFLFTRQFPKNEVAVGQKWKDKTYLRTDFEEFECKLEEVGKFAGRTAFKVNFRNIPGKSSNEFYTGYAWYALENGKLLEGSVIRKTIQHLDNGAVHLTKFGIRAK